MFAFPCCHMQSRAFQISSSGEFDPLGSNLAQKCTYQLKSEQEFKKLFVSMTCLPTAHRLGHSDLAWMHGLGSQQCLKRTNLCHHGFLRGSTGGGIWMSGTSCPGAPGLSQSSALEWLPQDTALQCESHRLQPGLVKTLPETDGDEHLRSSGVPAP